MEENRVVRSVERTNRFVGCITLRFTYGACLLISLRLLPYLACSFLSNSREESVFYLDWGMTDILGLSQDIRLLKYRSSGTIQYV